MKKILIMIPYDLIYPPMNGGMQRCINILHQLTRHFDVTAIINQDKEAFLPAIHDYPSLAKANIYSTFPGRKKRNGLLPVRVADALTYRWQKRLPFSTTDSNFLLYYPVLSKLLKENQFDVVVLENLDSLNAVSVIRRHDKKVRIIFDAHNVDTVLAEAAFIKGHTSKDMADRIRYAEEHISEKANALIACSQNDLNVLCEMNAGQLTGEVVPNGVRWQDGLSDSAVHADDTNSILFCGTLGSVANLEGLKWFYDHVWPTVSHAIPLLKLLVVGSGHPPPEMEQIKKDERIVFSGAVPDVAPWYNRASVAVVPLLTGSGTRLKILEAMAMGLPIVSTSIGAEGIEYTDGTDILIADSNTFFAKQLIGLVQDKMKRKKLQQNALQLVKNRYEWNIIGDKMATFINK